MYLQKCLHIHNGCTAINTRIKLKDNIRSCEVTHTQNLFRGLGLGVWGKGLGYRVSEGEGKLVLLCYHSYRMPRSDIQGGLELKNGLLKDTCPNNCRQCLVCSNYGHYTWNRDIHSSNSTCAPRLQFQTLKWYFLWFPMPTIKRNFCNSLWQPYCMWSWKWLQWDCTLHVSCIFFNPFTLNLNVWPGILEITSEILANVNNLYFALLERMAHGNISFLIWHTNFNATLNHMFSATRGCGILATQWAAIEGHMFE